jgi:MoxR-like ATPase
VSDRDDLQHVQRLIKASAPTLLIQTESGVYPYEVGRQLQPPGKFSTSTNAMVAHSAACVAGLLVSSTLVGFALVPNRDNVTDDSFRRRAQLALDKLVQQIKSPRSDNYLFSSTAFGHDDPFTIGWLLELLTSAKSWCLEGDRKDIGSVLGAVIATAKERVSESLAKPGSPVLLFSENKYDRAVVHSLPLLRVVQVANLLDAIDNEPYEEGLSDAFDWFLTHLHLQLSRRNIQHSGFDIAELVFCLEGLLASNRARVTSSILESVISALNDSRQLNSALRASTPFKVTAVGAVHLFTSVEVVSSLLRSTALLDVNDRRWFFKELKPTLRHYLAWLQATLLSGEISAPSRHRGSTDPYPDDTPTQFSGWHSEHAHTDDNRIDIWLTSLVLLFLRSYETLLSDDIAMEALEASGLRPERQRQADLTTKDRLIRAQQDDPLQLGDESPYRVVSRLEEFFIGPRMDGKVADAWSYSCLLYGPPGSGKTTLARRVARELGWPLITITTSDFIIDGEAQVEARAKNIFQTLELQVGAVIFFDEIDRLLLDRDASDYSKQGDMLQFMTPSMLTKINDLRRAERSVFIIGTNYADRIDPAIKRAGRIDHKFLVLPPDLNRRIYLIDEELKRFGVRPSTSDEDVKAAAIAGVGRSIAEIKSAIRTFARKGGRLSEFVSDVSPAVSLSTYRKRLNASFDEGVLDLSKRELFEEAYLLAYLTMEGHMQPEHSGDYDWLAKHWVAVKNEGIVRDAAVRARLDALYGGSK